MNMKNNIYINAYNSLSPKERLSIIDKLINKGCVNCRNGLCRIESYEKVGYDEDGNLEGYQCLGWNNEKIVGKSKILKIYDIKKLTK